MSAQYILCVCEKLKMFANTMYTIIVDRFPFYNTDWFMVRFDIY